MALEVRAINDNYEKFKKDIHDYLNIDLNSYKERQMKRRIDSLIFKNGCSSYSEYFSKIKGNKSSLDQFMGYFTINVSEFFRNPAQWEVLEKLLISEIVPKNQGISAVKIWSAACSTGEEPYSIAMLLDKNFPGKRFEIIATDIDNEILESAKLGIYDEKSVKNVKDEFKSKYFNRTDGGKYQVIDKIKKMVSFRNHDLIKDFYGRNYDLIVCRNVMIYFTEEAKLAIYKKFCSSLKSGGYLFIGSTEQIIKPVELGFKTENSFFYKKVVK